MYIKLYLYVIINIGAGNNEKEIFSYFVTIVINWMC